MNEHRRTIEAQLIARALGVPERLINADWADGLSVTEELEIRRQMSNDHPHLRSALHYLWPAPSYRKDQP